MIKHVLAIRSRLSIIRSYNDKSFQVSWSWSNIVSKGAQYILDLFHNHSPYNTKYSSDRSIHEKHFHLQTKPFDLLLLIYLEPFSIPQTKTIFRTCGIIRRDQVTIIPLNIVGWYHGMDPWYSLTLIFHPIHTFPYVKVRVYVYAPFILLTCVYMLLGQSEPAYTS